MTKDELSALNPDMHFTESYKHTIYYRCQVGDKCIELRVYGYRYPFSLVEQAVDLLALDPCDMQVTVLTKHIGSG
jgi:uncharacterized protein (DUF427 family)